MEGAKCIECGGLGIDIQGNPCEYCEVYDIKIQDQALENAIIIPPQYLGNTLDTALCSVTSVMYRSILEDIANQRIPKGKNILVTSKKANSKKVAAYTCIQKEFVAGFNVLPVIDIQEAGAAMKAIDLQRWDSGIDLFKIEQLMQVDYLFVELGNEFSFSTFENFKKLINRRNRRGKGVIFFSNYSWEFLVSIDPTKSLEQYNGDGSYETVKVYDCFHLT